MPTENGKNNMSVQFGRWNFAGEPMDAEYINKINATFAPYSPDGNNRYVHGGVSILYGAFHTTAEGHQESQPHIAPSGAVITWDGRLDNRAELLRDLGDCVLSNPADVTIVAAAYEKWGINCVARLLGEWALSVWNPTNRSLFLAKDLVGTHHLYYSLDNNHVVWSTLLDPLVLLAAKTFGVCEEYIAGWFSRLPSAHLTPFVGILAVPPSSLVRIQPGKQTISKYWDFDPAARIRYSTDAEYEEHFRALFSEAVQNKLRCDRPILAELSGGMDSSSIVCMADALVVRGVAEPVRIDTVSWFDNSNSDTDERPYFRKVEERRGRVGCHIDLGGSSQRRDDSQYRCFRSQFRNDHFAAIPVSNSHLSSELFRQYAACLRSRGYRSVLSGIGGSEFMGDGVPTPVPELQDLIATARLTTLLKRLTAWASKMQTRRLPLLLEALRGFLPFTVAGPTDDVRTATWLDRDFARRNHTALRGYAGRIRRGSGLPSFQHQLLTLDSVRRILAFRGPQSELPREVRYPFLDRNLLRFIYALPRDQIVRVGQRRSLMRRALTGLLPEEILNRKQKASLHHELQQSTRNTGVDWPRSEDIGWPMVSSSMHIIDPIRFFEALQRARYGETDTLQSLRYTLTLEAWLSHLSVRGVVADSVGSKRPVYSPYLTTNQPG